MAAADFSIVPQRLNPDLTPELEREVRFFQKWGYLVIDDALTPEQVATLRAAMDDAHSRVTVGWGGEPNPGPYGSFFSRLLEEDDRFAFLLDTPPVVTRVTAILGNAVQLHSATGRVTRPGTPEQNWHRDGPWPQDPDGTPFGSLPGQINCGYYLDELTMDNGPVVILPGSHRALFRPPKESAVAFPDELYLFAKPGQAVLFKRLALPPRGRQRLGRQPPRLSDVLPERVDEVARDLRRAEDDRHARQRHAATEAAARRDSALVA